MEQQQAQQTQSKTKETYWKKLYSVWFEMIRRCTNPTCKDYSYYGAKGITVCDEWKTSFSCFYDWVLENGYEQDPSLTVDRIDGTLGYCPENCRLATRREQNLNREETIWIDAGGTPLCMLDAAKYFGQVSYTCAHKRYRRGWDPLDAVTVPLHEKPKGLLQ